MGLARVSTLVSSISKTNSTALLTNTHIMPNKLIQQTIMVYKETVHQNQMHWQHIQLLRHR